MGECWDDIRILVVFLLGFGRKAANFEVEYGAERLFGKSCSLGSSLIISKTLFIIDFNNIKEYT